MKWAGHAARIWRRELHIRSLVGKPEGRRPIGRREWEDNIKMDLRQTGWCGMDWIDLAQDRDQCRALVNTTKNFWVA
jgi:hypothetical protein